MGKSCKEIAVSLVECMQKTDCVKRGGDIKTCMKSHVAEDGTITGGDCQELRTAYMNCKRAGLDMRSRIRGPRVY
jgi:hypothetical protein